MLTKRKIQWKANNFSQISKFNRVLIKTPTSYFMAPNKLFLKFSWKGKWPKKSQNEFEVEEQWSFTVCQFIQARVMKVGQSWHMDQQTAGMDQNFMKSDLQRCENIVYDESNYKSVEKDELFLNFSGVNWLSI